MILAPAQSGDREAVNALALQVHRLHVLWRPDAYEDCDLLYPRERFDAEMEKGNLYVARADERIVGYVLVSVTQMEHPGLVKRSILRLEEICVDAGFRQRGLGKQIMVDVTMLASQRGCTDIQLACDPHNAAAIGLYESIGMNVKCIQYHLKLEKERGFSGD